MMPLLEREGSINIWMESAYYINELLMIDMKMKHATQAGPNT